MTKEQLAKLEALKAMQKAGIALTDADKKELTDLEALKAKSGDIEITKEVIDMISEKAAEVFRKNNEELMQKLQAVEGKLEDKIKAQTKSGIHTKALRPMQFMKAAIGLVSGNRDAIKEFNERSLELRAKAGYNNTGVNADGGYLIMDPEFEAAVEKIVPNYGVAFSEATVRQTDRPSFKTNKRGNNVVMYEITEAGNKTASKPTYAQTLVILREFAVIIIATDQLVEDAAVDFWADVQDGIAEERGRWGDILMFNDRTSGKEGLLHIAGTIAITVGANISSLTWDHLIRAELAVPTNARNGGKFYMHRSIWAILMQVKDSNGRYQWLPSMGNQTPWGTPVVLVDAMPASTDVGDNNEGYVLFGNLKRSRLIVKRGLEFLQSRDAVVTDSAGQSYNLFMQDGTGLRATTRMVALHKFPEAFAIIGNGTVS